MKDLLELREEIDEIDRDIVELFEKRMAVSEQVAEYKINTGKKVFDRDRERAKMETLTAMAHNDFNRHGIEELFQQIMSMSRKKQYQLLAKSGVAGRLPFIGVDELEKQRERLITRYCPLKTLLQVLWLIILIFWWTLKTILWENK